MISASNQSIASNQSAPSPPAADALDELQSSIAQIAASIGSSVNASEPTVVSGGNELQLVLVSATGAANASAEAGGSELQLEVGGAKGGGGAEKTLNLVLSEWDKNGNGEVSIGTRSLPTIAA